MAISKTPGGNRNVTFEPVIAGPGNNTFAASPRATVFVRIVWNSVHHG
jgi:hypothetical protein